MRTSFSLLIVLMFVSDSICYSQQSAQFNFRIAENHRELSSIRLLINGVAFELDGKANLLSVDNLKGGDFDFWSSTSEHPGMLRSIGDMGIEYWSSTSYDANKIRSVGNINIEFWSPTSVYAGKLRSIGDISFDYWSSTSIDANKLRSIGNVAIEYWSPTSSYAGKIRSIGNVEIEYWTSGEDAGKIRYIKGNTPNLYVSTRVTL